MDGDSHQAGQANQRADIDVIYVNGCELPGWWGGPMFYADSVGLKGIVQRISCFEREFGGRWKVSPLLQHLAEDGNPFRSFDEQRGAQEAGYGPVGRQCRITAIDMHVHLEPEEDNPIDAAAKKYFGDSGAARPTRNGRILPLTKDRFCRFFGG